MNTVSNKQSKRRQPATESQEFVSATGRSFKRLRLDPSQNSSTPSSFFSSFSHQSSSNNIDEAIDNNYLGEDERELHQHPTEERRMNQKQGINHSSAESGDEGESMASSWVASLQSMGSNNNGMFRKSRQQQLKMSQSGESTTKYSGNNDDDNSNHNDSCDGYYHNDDISCAAMTTAAVAPRKRRFSNGNKLQCRAPMKKSVKYHPQQFSIDERNCNENNIGDDDDDLQVEELDMMNMNPPPNKFVSIENKNMPDPLLVAAQHAMVGGGVERQQQLQQQQRSQPNPNNISSVLLIGECCSSVTEEESSLAEDEASLSAISIGANTIMSALSGPGDGKSVVLGAPSPLPQPATAAVAASSTAQHQFGAPSVATTQPSSDFSSLNNVLGGLHRERMARRNSSFHSLGSDGCHTNDGSAGGSLRSMPNHSSGYHHRQNMVHLPPPTAYVPKSTFTSAMQSHAEDEEMEDAVTENVGGGMDTSAGSNSNSGGEGIPKWKRRVNLQSHSSLY